MGDVKIRQFGDVTFVGLWSRFIEDCSDGNVAKIERIDEARWWLQNMKPHRVG